MTVYTRRATIVVPVSRLGQANARADEVVLARGTPTFSSGLTPNGGGEITHYWCSWKLTPSQWSDLISRWTRPLSIDWIHDETWTREQILDYWGLQPFKPEVA